MGPTETMALKLQIDRCDEQCLRFNSEFPVGTEVWWIADNGDLFETAVVERAWAAHGLDRGPRVRLRGLAGHTPTEQVVRVQKGLRDAARKRIRVIR